MSISPLPQTEDKSLFYRTAFAVALPVVIEHLVSILLNMMDTLMIGKLGMDQLAGVGAANRVFFVFLVVCWGFYSGAGIYLAQYWGQRDIINIRRILGLDYAFGLVFSLAVMAACWFWAPQITRLFTKDATVIGYGADYLRIVQLSYLFAALSQTLTTQSRAIHQLKYPVLINGLALAVNTGLNYVLIYGKLGFPALGVRGAAWATVAARVIELAVLLLYVYGSHAHPFAARWRELLDWKRNMVKSILRTATPALISETTWSVGQLIYYVAYGKVSTAALAVVQICGNANDLFTAVFYGLGNACAVMIGNVLGQNRRDLAYAYSRRFLWLTLGFCLLMSGAFLASIPTIVQIYGYDAVTNLTLSRTLLIYAIYTTPRMLVYTMFLGILRAGGDTTFSMLLDVLGIWCAGVPLAFLAAVTWQWPLELVVAVSLVDELFKLVLCIWRIRSRKWIKLLVDETDY